MLIQKHLQKYYHLINQQFDKLQLYQIITSLYFLPNLVERKVLRKI